MVRNYTKSEHKYPEHTSPTRNTSEKLSAHLNTRILRDVTHLLDPYQQSQSDSIITTLTHILHRHDRTHKFLRSLDIDSQRVTQSSPANQAALDSMTSLFNSTNLHR